MSNLSKYWQVFCISWSNGFVYRLNFVMWRVRMVIGMLTIYYLWQTVLQNNHSPFGYSPNQLLTFVFGTSLLRSLVFGSRSIDAQGEISSGNLNNYLLKPLSYFKYWFARDIADKLLNIFFFVGELAIIFLLISPPLLPPANLSQLLLFLIASMGAMLLYFMFSFLVSMSTFWLPEGNGWPQRFFIMVILEFLAGGLFPLDILPVSVRALITHLPSAYFLHFPMQVYLGRIDAQSLISGFSLLGLWLFLFYVLMRHAFARGLKVYGAYGR